jgi:hypothetical protein
MKTMERSEKCSEKSWDFRPVTIAFDSAFTEIELVANSKFSGRDSPFESRPRKKGQRALLAARQGFSAAPKLPIWASLSTVVPLFLQRDLCNSVSPAFSSISSSGNPLSSANWPASSFHLNQVGRLARPRPWIRAYKKGGQLLQDWVRLSLTCQVICREPMSSYGSSRSRA